MAQDLHLKIQAPKIRETGCVMARAGVQAIAGWLARSLAVATGRQIQGRLAAGTLVVLTLR
ncbi:MULTISPECIES: hypothetical protein [Pseudomonas]|uniref:Uncharacterized protein n=1 Tax=Pseudomonas sessilinigenes TaxID=658629 RepID=A0ABX8MX17_9PSED|nr:MULTISPECIES: hypothetical protein [Pseudomonas]AZC23773.1 hypothetical protein C4K39_2089 [Pseudomonas sessilinigenes]QXH42759.1 hypothetical protein KSS89_11185 [Pseudomonas sessilinigenes]UMZ14040.1 hypothetical protein I9018_10180 [Pseudomonas sp. MPFS]